MEDLLPMVKNEDYLAMILGYKRVYRLAELEDFTRSHYLYNMDKALERMERHIHAAEVRKYESKVVCLYRP